MSHSFACCAAPIFSQASWENLCAAARFGCFLPLTFSTGFWAMAMPPQINAAPRAVLKTILALVILRILLFERFRIRTPCKLQLGGEVALSCCGGTLFFSNKQCSKRTQTDNARKDRFLFLPPRTSGPKRSAHRAMGLRA